MNKELLDAIREKGLLLEKDILTILESFRDPKIARSFLEQIERISGQKMITKNLLTSNVGYVNEFVSRLPGEDKISIEKIFVNFGLSFEVRREKEVIEQKKPRAENNSDFKIFYADTAPERKIEVKDFTTLFRARYHQIQRILMSRPEIQQNLVSINKIGGERASVSIIGMVKEKKVTKNKNMIVTFEDLTGEIKALVKFDRPEIFAKAEELLLDDIVGLKASGSRDILFVYDIFYPDSFILEKKRFEQDMNIAFISDTHCGSNRHLAKSLNKFFDWLNGDDESAKKIKYIFFVGDTVDGVGVFPGQEDVLDKKNMEEQYEQLAGYLRRVPKHITIFLCPGQHDATRVAEPQPIISKKYAPQLYELENVILVTNPTLVKLLEGDKEFKVLMYHGASIHTLINEIKTLRVMKAHTCPAKAVEQMLKRRHLAPTYGVSPSIVYVPNGEYDPLVINEVPDVLCTGEVHRLDISSYNGVLIITGSCWQAQTPFEEKIGNIPNPCKVAVMNLKSRELKVFDFSDETEVDNNGAWVGGKNES